MEIQQEHKKEERHQQKKISSKEMTQDNDSQSSETVNNELEIVDNFQKINYDYLLKDIEIKLDESFDIAKSYINEYSINDFPQLLIHFENHGPLFKIFEIEFAASNFL